MLILEDDIINSLDPLTLFRGMVLNKLMVHPSVLDDIQDKLGPSQAQLDAERAAISEKKAPEAEVKVEKMVFNVILTGYEPAQKVKIIKEIKTMLNLGLKEAKDMVDNVPSTLYKDMPKQDAEKMIETLKGFGCQITLE